MKQSIFEASEALQKWEGMILKKKRLFHWLSSNSEVEATWISLIGWPHKTSSMYVVLLYMLILHSHKKWYIVCIHNIRTVWVRESVLEHKQSRSDHFFINNKKVERWISDAKPLLTPQWSSEKKIATGNFLYLC